MLADWLKNDLTATKVGHLNQLINTLELNEDVIASSELDAIQDSMDMVGLAVEQTEALFTKLTALKQCPKGLAEAVVVSTNSVLYPTGVTVSMENLFTTDDEETYIVSMEGIDITWKEIWRFVKAATRTIADVTMKFFGRRLTLMGQLHTKASHLERELKKVKLVNAPDLAKMKLRSEGPARNLVSVKSGKDANSLFETTVALGELITTLDPKPYRIHIEAYVSLLASSKTTSIEDMTRSVNGIRKDLHSELVNYFNALHVLESNGAVSRNNVSDLLPGGNRFYVSSSTMDFRAPEVRLETGKDTRSQPLVFAALTPEASVGISGQVALALDTAMELRQDYLDVRNFKVRADDAVKNLKERNLEDTSDRSFVALYRSIPSYVKCYSAPLKLKSELLYLYCLGLMDMIKLSYAEWEVKL